MTAPVEAKRRYAYVEAAQRLLRPPSKGWKPAELLDAASKAELGNTAWPIGRVIDSEGSSPVATTDGIEARVWHHEPVWEDYWSFQNDGSYYVVRRLEEEFGQPNFSTSQGHPTKMFWFDVRLWRIAEILLHGARLYQCLGLPPATPYSLSITHAGLSGREFWASQMDSALGEALCRGRIAQTDRATWQRELTQDYVVTNLKELVADVAEGLFVLFNFASVPRSTTDQVVETFLRRRVR